MYVSIDLKHNFDSNNFKLIVFNTFHLRFTSMVVTFANFYIEFRSYLLMWFMLMVKLKYSPLHWNMNPLEVTPFRMTLYFQVNRWIFLIFCINLYFESLILLWIGLYNIFRIGSTCTTLEWLTSINNINVFIWFNCIPSGLSQSIVYT